VPYFLSSKGSRIYYDIRFRNEAKPDIVFLNGTAQTTINWMPIAQSIQDFFSIILYDAAPQGKSSIGGSTLGIETHVTDLRDLIDHLGLTRII
jgi:pimeloyl-ACP methyl ester carboxylesterase